MRIRYISCCPRGPLNYPHFRFLFSFCCSGGFIFLPCLSNCWFGPLIPPTYCLFIPVYSSLQILYSSFLTGHVIFFMVSMSFSMLLHILITITMTSISYKLHCAISFGPFFLEISPVLSYGACFFVAPFWLPLCVCFYVLGRSAMTPSLCAIALCSRCPVGSSDSVSLITWAGCSRNVCCVGYEDPPIIIEFWLLLASHLCVG